MTIQEIRNDITAINARLASIAHRMENAIADGDTMKIEFLKGRESSNQSILRAAYEELRNMGE
jgi:hypothetical protein